jgi:hypothetical protein
MRFKISSSGRRRVECGYGIVTQLRTNVDIATQHGVRQSLLPATCGRLAERGGCRQHFKTGHALSSTVTTDSVPVPLTGSTEADMWEVA